MSATVRGAGVNSGGGGGIGGKTSSWAATAAAAAAATGSNGRVEVTHQSLKDFYLKHNPPRARDEKIAEVLERYKGRHKELLVNLYHMYKAVPATQPESLKEGSSGTDSNPIDKRAQVARPTAAPAAATSAAEVGSSAAIGSASGTSGSNGGGDGDGGKRPFVASPSAATATENIVDTSLVVQSVAQAPQDVPAAAELRQQQNVFSPSKGLTQGQSKEKEQVQGNAKSAVDRLEQLEQEVREKVQTLASTQAQLAAVRPQVRDLEARWEEVSTISEDACRQARETREQVLALRRAVEQKDAQIAAIEGQRASAAAEAQRAVQQHEKLGADFNARLQREREQKEEELLRHAATLRKEAEVTDRQIKEMASQKGRLERLEVASGFGHARSENIRESMLDAHNTIAKAFSDVSTGVPCVRAFDEPLLKLTAALFRHAIFRRVFLVGSAFVWVFALLHASL
eukprot:TRINITY_DN51991_c0_g1_i1.p1 TRINITY_DN51991_c0_g1~~TRINITY_DN51991_c0_g1_i1.p1  ORF type:complete len:490 (-),score=119.56 TRINITY_DN51991_c0_g1_i1:69-1439(-)